MYIWLKSVINFQLFGCIRAPLRRPKTVNQPATESLSISPVVVVHHKICRLQRCLTVPLGHLFDVFLAEYHLQIVYRCYELPSQTLYDLIV